MCLFFEFAFEYDLNELCFQHRSNVSGLYWINKMEFFPFLNMEKFDEID